MLWTTLSTTLKTLFPAQQRAKKILLQALATYGAALDGSATGLGKTVVATDVLRELDGPVAIIAPKIVLPSWEKELEEAGVEALFIKNVEALRHGRGEWVTKKPGTKKVYNWQLPKGTTIVVDECHKYAGEKSQNCALHIAATNQGFPTLNLSATVASKAPSLKAVGFALGLHGDMVGARGRPKFSTWCMAHGCRRDQWRNWRPGGAKHLLRIHEAIFKGDVPRGVRLTVADMPEAFQENRIITEALDFGPEIRGFYEDIGLTPSLASEWMETGALPEHEFAIVEVLRARQLAEFQKAPAIVEMVGDLLEEGNSVAVFVNFRETLATLYEALGHPAIIVGGQTPQDREWMVEEFQSDRARVILVMSSAGGTGVSLHDTHGKHPRVSLISPSFSEIEFTQVLGRTYRNGAKSPSIQKILVAADTVEEDIVKILQRKIRAMGNLLDGGVRN